MNAQGQRHNAQVFSKQKKGLRAKTSQIFYEISGVLREISGEEKKVMTLAHF